MLTKRNYLLGRQWLGLFWEVILICGMYFGQFLLRPDYIRQFGTQPLIVRDNP